jgi:membrane-associated phospholipid phosphatase
VVSAERASAEPMPSPIDSLGDDIVGAFTEPVSLVLYGSAVVSTLVLVPTGADHSLRVAVQESIHAPAWGNAAYYGGYVLPLVVAPGLYVGGLVTSHHATAGAGSAALQALAITFATTVVLKVGTGRPFPLHGGDRNAPDRLDHPEYATEFAPFHFGGYYAWPSGHTSSTVAIAAALTAFTEDPIVALVGYPIALGIGMGMIVADRHWTSDVVAGACLGQAIGWSVGAAYRRRLDGSKPSMMSIYFLPTVGTETGLRVGGWF